MYRNRLLLILSCASLALPSRGALQFVDVTASVGTPNTLTAAAYDGASTFVVVGTNSTVARGVFLGPNVQWSKTSVPASFRSVTYGSGLFLAGAAQATLFKSID